MTATAAEFKDKGNKALVASHFAEAVDMYTKAIELDSTNAIYFANRAQAQIKLEAYGLAISDATESIKLDPKYTKAYYRRAVASAAIIKYKDAVDDFKKVVEQAPGDAQAKSRLVECQKLLRRQAFEKAIEIEDAPSVLESLDIEAMAVDATYDGPELEIVTGNTRSDISVNMTESFIVSMTERYV
jgi:serine/threonine-protein phosphatase 5